MNVDANDHPHARTVRDGMLPVEFDFSLWRALRQIGLQLDTIAAITANDDLGELGLEPPPPSAFPVRPIDEEQQTDRVLRQLDNAIEAGAKIIVLPELSTTPELMRRIQRRLDHDGEQRLVICGSWHQADPADGQPANLSLGLVSGLPAKMRHRKIVEFGDLYPSVPRNRRGCRSRPLHAAVLPACGHRRTAVARMFAADVFDNMLDKYLPANYISSR